jgi:hypothetical protein
MNAGGNLPLCDSVYLPLEPLVKSAMVCEAAGRLVRGRDRLAAHMPRKLLQKPAKDVREMPVLYSQRSDVVTGSPVAQPRCIIGAHRARGSKRDTGRERERIADRGTLQHEGLLL